MEKEYALKDIVEYIVSMISDFAAKYNLTEQQAFRYLNFHKGISFLEENYGIIHTLSFEEALESLTMFCRRSGGKL